MSVLVIPVVVTFAILFIPFLSVAVITISTDFAFLFFIVCVTVGGVLFAGRACAGIAVLYDEGVGADFTGTGILQDIKICDRELCVCRGHPEDISNYGR